MMELLYDLMGNNPFMDDAACFYFILFYFYFIQLTTWYCYSILVEIQVISALRILKLQTCDESN